MTDTKFRTVPEALAFHAAHHPDRVALFCEDRRITFAALHAESDRLARALGAAGFGPGDRVAYLGLESEHYYELFFACAKRGAVLVPINWRLTAAEVDHILRDSSTALLFTERELLAVVDESRQTLPRLRAVIDVDGDGPRGSALRRWKEQPGPAALEPSPAPGPEAPLIQLYTSGTTGLPKGVVLAQRSFFKIRDGFLEQRLDWIDWKPDDVSLIGIPGFHVAGIWWAMQAIAAGVPSVSMRVFRAKDAVQLIEAHGVTTTLIVPAMLHMLLSEPRVGERLASLRKVGYGGSPISESLLRQAMELLGCELTQLYGLTESGNVAVCLPPKDHVVGSPLMRAAGRPCPGVRVKVVDTGGQEVEPGEVGELCLHTPAVMLEYWGLPEATRGTLVDGWLHTGDAGYVDAEGYVFISDRIKDTIIVAGENVFPAEVEAVLHQHPAVAMCAVVPVADAQWGEVGRAVIVLRAGATASVDEIVAHCRAHLARYKIPRHVEFRASLPLSPAGKILRRELRDEPPRPA